MNNFQQFAPFKLTQQVLLKLLGGLPNARKLGVQLNQAQVKLHKDYLATHLFALPCLAVCNKIHTKMYIINSINIFLYQIHIYKVRTTSRIFMESSEA